MQIIDTNQGWAAAAQQGHTISTVDKCPQEASDHQISPIKVQDLGETRTEQSFDFAIITLTQKFGEIIDGPILGPGQLGQQDL